MAVSASALAVGLTGCGGGGQAGAAPVQIAPQLSVTGSGRIVCPLPAGSWVVSFDVRLAQQTRLQLELGSPADGPTLSRGNGVALALDGGGGAHMLSAQPGWSRGGWRHVEATVHGLAIDGHWYRSGSGSGSAAGSGSGRGPRGMIGFHLSSGHAEINALIISAASDRASLLLHRLAELHARIPSRQYPIGADLADRIHYGSTYWTSGFWPGALWQAAAMAPAGGMFARWALQATIEHFGQERADTHDVGFMYGESSLAAWRARCDGRRGRSAAAAEPVSPPPLCARLKQSVLAAADELLALARTNPGAGTIPTDSRSRQGDTIIDSTMNLSILPWATRVTGNSAYARLASHHAHVVAARLVRPDGSTAQAVNFDRATGHVLSIATHQGLSDASTWSRGQGWAVYGFAQAAAELKDRGLLRIAVRAAGYVQRHLPSGGIPLWDYDAPAGAPIDVSAGVITAAGLMHLAAACGELSGVCGSSAGTWRALGRRMLAAALGREYAHPPLALGFLGDQILNERGRGCWCDGGELIFGLNYALEATARERATGA